MPTFRQSDLLPSSDTPSSYTAAQARQYAENFQAQRDDSAVDVMGAAVRQDNDVGSALANFIPSNFEVKPGDDERIDAIEMAESEGFGVDDLHRFEDVRTRKQYRNKLAQIRMEQEDREMLASGGVTAFLSQMVAGFSSPVNLIPIGGQAMKIYKTEQAFAQGAMRLGATGAAATATQEALLHSTQEMRTVEESVFAVGMSTFLTGLLGGAITQVKSNNVQGLKDLVKGLEGDVGPDALKKMEGFDKDLSDLYSRDMDTSAGAAQRIETTLAQETVKNPKLSAALNLQIEGINRTGLSPNLRILDKSPFVTSHRLIQELTETPYMMQKHDEGLASTQAIETHVKAWEGGRLNALREQVSQYSAYRKRIKAEGGTPLGKQEFETQVYHAKVNDHVHGIPEVATSAKAWDTHLFGPAGKYGSEVGIFPKEVIENGPKTAKTYAHRMYDIEKIKAHMPAFREFLHGHVEKAIIAARKEWLKKQKFQLGKLKSKLNKHLAERKKKGLNLDTREASELTEKIKFQESTVRRMRTVKEDWTNKGVARMVEDVKDSVTSKLTGDTLQDMSFVRPETIDLRGPMKGRTLLIPDNDLISGGWLNTDMDMVSSAYVRRVAPDIELHAKYGTADADKILQPIHDEFTQMSKGMKEGEELLNLRRQYENDVQELKTQLSILRGQYGDVTEGQMWHRIAASARLVNYARLLGGVMTSSLSDIAMPVFQHGFGRVFGDSLAPMVKSLTSDQKGFKAMLSDLRSAGQVSEWLSAGRVQTLAEIGDPYAKGTAFERFLSNGARVFSRMNGLSAWNDGMKFIAGGVAQNRIIKTLKNLDGASDADLKYLLWAGIDENTAIKFKKQLAKYGEEIDGYMIANVEKWDADDIAGFEVQKSWKAAVNKIVDNTIIEKGQADVPVFAHGHLGKTLLQFKTFSMAAHQRVLIAGLQRHDAAALQGVTSLVTMGMFTYFVKTLEKQASWEINPSGNRPELSDDPRKWILEGVDRSGLMAVLMELNNTVEKVGVPGLSQMAGGEPSSRYRSRSAVEGLLGPSVGTLTDVALSTGAIMSDSDLKRGDVNRMRRLIPFQNLLFIRHAFDAAADGVSDSMGLD